MKARIKATGEVLRVLDLDSERILVKYGSEVKSLRIHEVDLIPESVNDYPVVEPNWEQRRYEIAKDVMAALISAAGYKSCANNRYGDSVERDFTLKAIEYADSLIEELKKGGGR